MERLEVTKNSEETTRNILVCNSWSIRSNAYFTTLPPSVMFNMNNPISSVWHITPVCALYATIQFVNQTSGWKLKHTKTRSSLKQECPKNVPFIVSRGKFHPSCLHSRAWAQRIKLSLQVCSCMRNHGVPDCVINSGFINGSKEVMQMESLTW